MVLSAQTDAPVIGLGGNGGRPREGPQLFGDGEHLKQCQITLCLQYFLTHSFKDGFIINILPFTALGKKAILQEGIFLGALMDFCQIRRDSTVTCRHNLVEKK